MRSRPESYERARLQRAPAASGFDMLASTDAVTGVRLIIQSRPERISYGFIRREDKRFQGRKQGAGIQPEAYTIFARIKP